MRELKGDWRDLFNGFMVALDLRKCFLALCGIVVTIVLCGGMTIALGNWLNPPAVQPPSDLVLHNWWRTQCEAWHVIYQGKPLVALAYSVAFVLLFVAIWSYFGGAIARIAAYEVAKDGERIETRKALEFSRKKFWSFFWAPLICAIGFLFFAFCNYVGGLVGRVLDFIWIGAPLVALLLPLAILSGFIMTLIVIGTFAGLPLFTPAVAAEGTDSFDAVSRGFSYVYSRPWQYLGYQIVGAAYGYVSIAFVILFAIAMCHLGLEAGEEGFKLFGLLKSDTDFEDISNASWKLILSEAHRSPATYAWDPLSIVADPSPYGRLQVLANQIVGVNYESAPALKSGHVVAHVLVTIWLAITLGLALGYVVSYFISQQTIIYYILRKKVDGIEMNEVFEEQEEEAKGTAPEPAPSSSAAPASAPPEKPSAPPQEEKK
jgi:hypothetical protein